MPGTCGGGKPYMRTSDNPKMNGGMGDVRRPYITGGLVGPAMEYSNDMDKRKKKRDDEDEDDEEKMAKARKSRKKGAGYGTGMA
tara:strand:+ start:178 stop:429 length:252 start_codon:yes stop_codon:yes gene_type:complete